MTDAQLIGLVIALAVTPLATLTVVLFGKSSEHRYIKVEVELCETRITARLDKMESALLHRMADLDIRMGKLENR